MSSQAPTRRQFLKSTLALGATAVTTPNVVFAHDQAVITSAAQLGREHVDHIARNIHGDMPNDVIKQIIHNAVHSNGGATLVTGLWDRNKIAAAFIESFEIHRDDPPFEEIANEEREKRVCTRFERYATNKGGKEDSAFKAIKFLPQKATKFVQTGSSEDRENIFDRALQVASDMVRSGEITAVQYGDILKEADTAYVEGFDLYFNNHFLPAMAQKREDAGKPATNCAPINRR